MIINNFNHHLFIPFKKDSIVIIKQTKAYIVCHCEVRSNPKKKVDCHTSFAMTVWTASCLAVTGIEMLLFILFGITLKITICLNLQVAHM